MIFGNRFSRLSLFCLGFATAVISVSGCAADKAKNESTSAPAPCQSPSYVFGWQFIEDNCDFSPRGGTSTGAQTTKDSTPSVHWRNLQKAGLSTYERDREAILALPGYFRVSFDFIETMGFSPDYQPSKPYRSWGTEWVAVVEDKPDFISLQHIMVMVFVDENGQASEPMVMKHWRQDWQYEKPSEFVYAGNQTWENHPLDEQQNAGHWSQSVFQVDDSPRYESQGVWEHKGNHSQWVSDVTWRPLPRRESSVRSDYQVLEGVNKHIILPDGWVQEEENYKLVLSDSGEPSASSPYITKEFGIARYERIKDHDFSPGETYWKKTANYWRDVRTVWHELAEQNNAIVISKKANGVSMFMPFFGRAQEIADGGQYNSDEEIKQIRSTLAPYLKMVTDPQEQTQ